MSHDASEILNLMNVMLHLLKENLEIMNSALFFRKVTLKDYDVGLIEKVECKAK